MSGVLFISPDDGVRLVDRERFEREVVNRYGDTARLRASNDGSVSDVEAFIERPGETVFHLYHSREHDTIWSDATPEQAVDIALWVCSLLPEVGSRGRVWMTDEGFNGHVELRPGMTATDLSAGWIDHEDEPPELGEND